MIRHILVMLLAISNISVAAIITHSHCPNHTRNNSDNMHTHDTSDPDHNAKHVSGHPHTWEYDEFCPDGYERDTRKKSHGFPTKTTPTDVKTGTGDGTASPVRGISSPGVQVPNTRPQYPVRVTEYMMRDWSNHRGQLPQWVEIYNPNTSAVNLLGYTLKVKTYSMKNGHQEETVTISDLSIPPRHCGLLVSQLTTQHSENIDTDRVFNIGFGNILKRGWVLSDPNGVEVP